MPPVLDTLRIEGSIARDGWERKANLLEPLMVHPRLSGTGDLHHVGLTRRDKGDALTPAFSAKEPLAS